MSFTEICRLQGETLELMGVNYKQPRIRQVQDTLDASSELSSCGSVCLGYILNGPIVGSCSKALSMWVARPHGLKNPFHPPN